jgi:DNA-binding response OmpR family regulator
MDSSGNLVLIADDWVTKPFDPAVLVAKVKHHLRLTDAGAVGSRA